MLKKFLDQVLQSFEHGLDSATKIDEPIKSAKFLSLKEFAQLLSQAMLDEGFLTQPLTPAPALANRFEVFSQNAIFTLELKKYKEQPLHCLSVANRKSPDSLAFVLHLPERLSLFFEHPQNGNLPLISLARWVDFLIHCQSAAPQTKPLENHDFILALYAWLAEAKAIDPRHKHNREELSARRGNHYEITAEAVNGNVPEILTQPEEMRLLLMPREIEKTRVLKYLRKISLPNQTFQLNPQSKAAMIEALGSVLVVLCEEFRLKNLETLEGKK